LRAPGGHKGRPYGIPAIVPALMFIVAAVVRGALVVVAREIFQPL
jgi:hypothetical protein